mgnify:CR=1 FL=1
MPKVSIVIPVYNAEKYLRKTLDSVINQTLKDIEIICVDDGSIDNSFKILYEYKKFDDRIIIVSQSNQGSGAARNFALNLAHGKYISFMDADDFYPDENVLSDLYDAAINFNVNIVGGSLIEVLPDLRIRERYNAGDPRAFSNNSYVKYIDYQYDYYYQRFLYSKEFLKTNNIVFPLYKRHQDVGFFIQAMIIAEKFLALKRATYCYRVSDNKIILKRKIILEIINAIKENMILARKNNLKILYKRLLMRLIKQYIVFGLTLFGFNKFITKLYVKIKKEEQDKYFR